MLNDIDISCIRREMYIEPTIEECIGNLYKKYNKNES